MDNKFGGVIWTNHALKRLKERKISQGDAWATFRRPEQSRYAKAKGALPYMLSFHAMNAKIWNAVMEGSK